MRDGKKCRVEKRETGKRGTTAGQENAGKSMHGKPNGVLHM